MKHTLSTIALSLAIITPTLAQSRQSIVREAPTNPAVRQVFTPAPMSIAFVMRLPEPIRSYLLALWFGIGPLELGSGSGTGGTLTTGKEKG